MEKQHIIPFAILVLMGLSYVVSKVFFSKKIPVSKTGESSPKKKSGLSWKDFGSKMKPNLDSTITFLKKVSTGTWFLLTIVVMAAAILWIARVGKGIGTELWYQPSVNTAPPVVPTQPPTMSYGKYWFTVHTQDNYSDKRISIGSNDLEERTRCLYPDEIGQTITLRFAHIENPTNVFFEVSVHRNSDGTATSSPPTLPTGMTAIPKGCYMVTLRSADVQQGVAIWYQQTAPGAQQ